MNSKEIKEIIKSTILGIAIIGLVFAQISCGEISRPNYVSTDYTTAQKEAGIAVAIVYDTSGSMGDSVPNATGGFSPKFAIANRAVLSVSERLKNFVAANPNKPVEACLITFSEQQKIDLAKFDPAPFVNFANNFNAPSGGTPLGGAIAVAAKILAKSPLTHRHIIVMTDGESNEGWSPETVYPGIASQGIALYMIAFDVDSKVFNAIKKQGATIVSASDEKQLSSQLTTILQKKVLLEDAE